ncbi:hypothetical protein CHS0354_019410 [Potamilus streckersoni]|uniref:Ribosomal protein L13 n=1 Tax=Potamilus streckersoni TaxID=2493646 RepID=A0AAE0SI15_9BIVA|nr:hypothetical protein CHS0354_019410 [Potamilus streckersoni]
MAHNRVLQWATMARTWWLFDAYRQCPFKSSSKIAYYLIGKHKPIYDSLSDIGDHVVVINSKYISMPNDYWRVYKYFHHTGYPGGFSETAAWRLHEVDPTKVIEKAVYFYLPKNLLRRGRMRRLHIFPEEQVPTEILTNISDQIQQVQPVPKRLDEYTQEEIESFPKLFDWPEDFVLQSGFKMAESLLSESKKAETGGKKSETGGKKAENIQSGGKKETPKTGSKKAENLQTGTKKAENLQTGSKKPESQTEKPDSKKTGKKH